MKTKRYLMSISVRATMCWIILLAMILYLRRTSAKFGDIAEHYAKITTLYSKYESYDNSCMNESRTSKVLDPWVQRMTAKYWRLSDYPWLWVEDDELPPPEGIQFLKKMRSSGENYNVACKTFRRTNPPFWTILWTWKVKGQ